jgi:ribosomal protein S18 acetylase RimI-like enzyme
VEPTPTLRDAAAVLAAAFSRTALFTHVEPDLERREARLPWLFEGSLLHCARHGGVEVVGDLEAVAAWVPGERLSLTAADLVRTGLVATPARLGARPTLRLERHERPSEERLRAALREDSAYLWVLGVAPSAQGTGCGSRALRAALEGMRAAGHDHCLLRTDDEHNVRWYARQGFEVVEHLDRLPSGLPAWILGRELAA